jgi:hypothetical protein
MLCVLIEHHFPYPFEPHDSTITILALLRASQKGGDSTSREKEVNHQQRRPFAHVRHPRCGLSKSIVKPLNMNVHDHIANREHSSKTSANGHRPAMTGIYRPICCNQRTVGYEPAARHIVEDEWHNG